MTENKNFDVYLYDGELYADTCVDYRISGATDTKLEPLLKFLKDESLVDDKSSLKDEVLTLEEFKNSSIEKIGVLRFQPKYGYTFSFNQGKLNPFKQQLESKMEAAFSIHNKHASTQTIIPYNSVSYYRVGYMDGLISSLILSLKDGTQYSIDNMEHDEYYNMLKSFNESIL